MSQLSTKMQLDMLYLNCVPFNTLKEELGLKGNKDVVIQQFKDDGYIVVSRRGWLHEQDIPKHLLEIIKKENKLNPTR